VCARAIAAYIGAGAFLKLAIALFESGLDGLVDGRCG
jgi:hypothetical protein